MKITLVIVLYKSTLNQSTTFCSLLDSSKRNMEFLKNVSIVIYDNSPNEQSLEGQNLSGLKIIYKHDSRNLGIASAYNYAWSIARENGSDWLMLLDHDTNLTDSYLDEVLNLPELNGKIAAIVPKVFNGNTYISPVYSQSLRPLQREVPVTGLQEQPVMAINSGALLKLDFLNEIGGFNEDFPLDYLDHWIFYKIYETGWKVKVLEATLEHELSVMDYSRVSYKRYQSIIDSEMKFYKFYKKDMYSSYRKQLAKRFLKQILTVKNKKIAMYTLRKLFSM
ncbi:glycosyltransferase [Neobacillus sp. Marseille-QA0830]